MYHRSRSITDKHRNTAQRAVHCILYKRWRDCIFTGIRNDYKIEGLHLILSILLKTTTYSKCSILCITRLAALQRSAQAAGSRHSTPSTVQHLEAGYLPHSRAPKKKKRIIN